MGRKDDEVVAAWRALTRLFVESKQQQRFLQAAAAAGITPVQMRTLFTLDPTRPQPVRNLRDVLECDASYATTTVDGLERLGYVERRVSPTDRRVKLVHLTPAGADVRARALRDLAVAPEALHALTLDEAAKLRRLLEKALAALDASRSEREALAH